MTIRQFPVSVDAGRTSELVDFTMVDDDGSRGWSAPVFAARIGRGDKVYKASASVWRFDTEAEARRRGYHRSDIVTTDDGEVFGVKLQTTVRNRQAVIVGWARDYAG